MPEQTIIMSPVAVDDEERVIEPRRLLLDTNVLLDYVDARREQHEVALVLVHLALERGLFLVAAASSYKDMYYILCRSLHSDAKGRDLMRRFIECVPITPLDLKASSLAPAIAGEELDFEDALVRHIAEREHVAAIVTRDATAFEGSPVPKFTPQEFLALMGE